MHLHTLHSLNTTFTAYTYTLDNQEIGKKIIKCEEVWMIIITNNQHNIVYC